MGILRYIQEVLAGAKGGKRAEVLSGKYATTSPGPSKSAQAFTSADLERLRDQLSPFSGPKKLDPEHASSLQMLLAQAEKPGVNTHVMYSGDDFSNPDVAFQLMANHELGDIGNYLPNLVNLSGVKGAGSQALQEARRAGPYGLVASPHSREFYEKMSRGRLKGFGPSEDPELDKVLYQFKAEGGAVTPYSEEEMEKLTHDELLDLRKRFPDSQDQLRIAPYEHRAFARELTAQNPANALGLLLSVPGYALAKGSGVLGARTPMSLNQIKHGYLGGLEGLKLAIDKLGNKAPDSPAQQKQQR